MIRNCSHNYEKQAPGILHLSQYYLQNLPLAASFRYMAPQILMRACLPGSLFAKNKGMHKLCIPLWAFYVVGKFCYLTYLMREAFTPPFFKSFV